MGHFAAAEANGDLDLVAVVEETPGTTQLDLVVVDIDARAHLDFLDVDGLLFFARLGGLLLLLVLELAVVEDLAYRRVGVRRYLDQIEADVVSHHLGFLRRDDAHHFSGFIYETDARCIDVRVDTRSLADRRFVSAWPSYLGPPSSTGLSRTDLGRFHWFPRGPPRGPAASSVSLAVASASARISCSLPPRRRSATVPASASRAPTTRIAGTLARLCSRIL